MNLNCVLPSALKLGANPYEELKHLQDKKVYALCRIQSAQKVMEALAVELVKYSKEAGNLARDQVYKFKDIELALLSNLRESIKEVSDRIPAHFVYPPEEPTEFQKAFESGYLAGRKDLALGKKE